MSKPRGEQIKGRIRVNKSAGTYRVEITDHGELSSCGTLDANGNAVHARIVEMISEEMSGNPATAELTLEGEKEMGMIERQGQTTVLPFEDEEDDGGFAPFEEEEDENREYDAGFGV